MCEKDGRHGTPFDSILVCSVTKKGEEEAEDKEDEEVHMARAKFRRDRILEIIFTMGRPYLTPRQRLGLINARCRKVAYVPCSLQSLNPTRRFDQLCVAAGHLREMATGLLHLF